MRPSMEKRRLSKRGTKEELIKKQIHHRGLKTRPPPPEPKKGGRS